MFSVEVYTGTRKMASRGLKMAENGIVERELSENEEAHGNYSEKK